MWDKLSTQYAQDSAAARFLLLDEFLSISKQPDESLTSLTARLEEALQKVKGSCKTDMTLAAFQEEMAMMTLIRALPEEFSNFRLSLLLVPGDLDFKKVKEAFLQEEQNRQPRASDQLAMKASSASSSSSSSRNRRPRPPYTGPACTHPKCPNPKTHSTQFCYARARDFMRQAEQADARQKASQAAKQAENSSASIAEVQEFAGNASAFDFTDPHSPLIADAGTDWLADTGATSHMTPHRHWFTTYQPHRVGIRLADHKVIYSTGCGSVRFQPVINGKPQHLFVEFHDVLHVPSLRSNLLSVLYLTRKKQYNVFINSACIAFKLQNRLLFTATINSNNAAHLDGQVVPPSEFAGRVSTCALDQTLWH